MTASNTPRSILALKVHQWMTDWDDVEFNVDAHRREPPHEFYMFTLNARELKLLSGIQRRKKTLSKETEIGIQRSHEVERSKEIGRFVRNGFPWSDLSEAKRESGEFDRLKKPGWLPTALVVNILDASDKRRGAGVDPDDLITVSSRDSGTATLTLPRGFSDPDWRPTAQWPIEVIDGQHRLWAFDAPDLGEDFELPVVAFHGLDISWQAYLFWTINIKPKRINTSLAFDLYPLLRSEDWLEKFEGHSIYRETRAQELVERLWSSPASPWFRRINMLGETGTGMLSQASWVRSLMATYVRSFEGGRVRVGGLFGAPSGQNQLVLPWDRAQQAAFLIYVWQEVQKAVRKSEDDWATDLRQLDSTTDDLAFRGPHSLLTQDQGVRGLLHVTNDICYVAFDSLEMDEWTTDQEDDENEVTDDLFTSLASQKVGKFIRQAASILSHFDWRAANAPGLTQRQRQAKLVFRGSGGYKEFRQQLLQHISQSEGAVGEAAASVLRQI